MGLLSSARNLFTSASGGVSNLRPKGYSGGWSGSWRFLDAADQYANNQIWYPPPRDFDRDVSPYDYQVTVAASRRLYANMGVAHIVDDKAMYSVGNAWLPKYTGKNRKWGEKAAQLLCEKYYPISSVRGPNFDFRKCLYLDSVNMDVSGDYGILLVKTKDGWPQTQRIPSHRIDSGDLGHNVPLKEGKYKGCKITQGVIYNKVDRPVAYNVRTDDQGYVQVPASSLIHVFDPAWYDQGRGLPAGTHAINDLKSIKKSGEFELMAQEILSSIGIVEENPEGGPDPNDPALRLRPGSTPGNPVLATGPVTTKTLFGGLWKFFKSNSGGKLSTLSHGRPGPNWESFQNRIVKSYCTGMSWSYEFSWMLHTLGGAALRAAISKCNRSVQDRQSVLYPAARREIQWAISCFITIGELEDDPDWYKWDFSLPPSMTVDIGREAQQQREDYRMKIITLQDIVGPLGQTTRQHYNQLADEYLERAEVAAEKGVPLEALSIPDVPALAPDGYKIAERVQ